MKLIGWLILVSRAFGRRRMLKRMQYASKILAEIDRKMLEVGMGRTERRLIWRDFTKSRVHNFLAE